MSVVRTVLGDIPTAQLGFCQSHEHLSIAKGWSWTVNSALRIDDLARNLSELEDYRLTGGCALVDAQPVGCGREALLLQTLSRRSRVWIIASTGFHKLCFYPERHWIWTMPPGQLATLFRNELEDGMYTGCDIEPPKYRTDIRAGQIKTALESGPLNGRYRELFHAAAQAAVETGAPIMVHIEAGSDPLALAAYLIDEGVRPERLIFCHMDRTIPALEIHYALCAQGITLEYDTVARPRYHDDRHEIGLVKKMLAAGHADHLLMGLDVTRRRLSAYGGEPGLAYIRRSFLPMMRDAGISQREIDAVFTHNPAVVFQYSG